jgi:hypothetical protein
MTPVSISKPEHSIEDGWHVASSSIAINGKTYQIKYRASEGPVATGSEPFLAAALLPAMKVEQALQVPGTVSPKLHAAIDSIQDIYHEWYPEFQKIPVHGEGKKSEVVGQATDVGAFFSGGVDSFYTLLKHQDEIEKIILIHGFNQYYSDTLRASVTKTVRQIARDFNKSLIEVETNVRELSDQYSDYTDHFVGIMLTSAGLFIHPQFRKIYIPSSFSYGQLHPAGTHPLLDPLWSIEDMTFVHDGCEANRAAKTARIAESETALRSLRVCFSSKDEYNNCGRCQNTMLALQAAGALERCSTFEQKLDPEKVAGINIGHPENIHFFKENLQALEKSGKNGDIVEALRACIKNFEHKRMADNLSEGLAEFLASKQGKRFVRGKQNRLFSALWESNPNFLAKETFKESLKKMDRKLFHGAFQKCIVSRKVADQ